MIIRIFAPSVPTKPLNDAQMRGAFLFIYVHYQNTYNSFSTSFNGLSSSFLYKSMMARKCLWLHIVDTCLGN